MDKLSRRDAITGMLATGTTILTATSDSSPQTETVANAFRGQHQPKPLPFNPSKLNGISEKVIKSHWENNYGGSVKALNAVERRLAAMMKEKDLPAYIYGDLKREELIRTGSVVLHEQYFANLGGNGKADGNALKLIEQWFGNYGNWEAEFKKTASSLSGGSGWTFLAYNQHTKELHNYWSYDHAHNPPFSVPLLVLDMYEHSYHMDYGAAAAKYIDAFMLSVNWEEVNRRVERIVKG
ncbi:MAG: Fe-Mn family superoxide dismutase [Pyrinomonadaceae bacterium]